MSAFLTSSEVCKLLEVSLNVLNRLEKKGLLKPKSKLSTNGKRFYSADDVDKYAESIANNKGDGGKR